MKNGISWSMWGKPELPGTGLCSATMDFQNTGGDDENDCIIKQNTPVWLRAASKINLRLWTSGTRVLLSTRPAFADASTPGQLPTLTAYLGRLDGI